MGGEVRLHGVEGGSVSFMFERPGGIGVDRWVGERVAWEYGGRRLGRMGKAAEGRRGMCGRRCDVGEVGAGRDRRW